MPPPSDAPSPPDPNGDLGPLGRSTSLTELYGDWFLDYASYVILERAVPDLQDGLKPVQRRLLHALQLVDDGRFHKVANIIGQTMQFHPHGDAAIGDALVNLGQKGLLLDTQGNWGDIRTGDGAAAARYIEVRLSRFAREVLFHPPITAWQLSYDGRKNEPVHLPVRFPLLLALGAEGIAVGLATRILPHNFNELVAASIACLRDEPFTLRPDFPTAGLADVSGYQDGRRGGRVRVRARVDIRDRRTLVVREIPFGTTTTGLIESIVKAADSGKIKIRRVVDNTAQQVEVLVELPPGVSPDVTLDALYAFTDCEVSLAPNACVIEGGRPVFLGVEELLRRSTAHTRALLQQALEVRHQDLQARWHFATLERIFIEERIYRDIETCTTWEAVLTAIRDGLTPHLHRLRQPLTEDDLTRLTEIQIKRISRYDIARAEEALRRLDEELAEVAHHLAHLTEYTIAWFQSLGERFGAAWPRRTELRSFETIQVAQVAAATSKLFVNRAEGFVGTALRRDEFVADCSELDDVIAFRADGLCQVSRVADKAFLGRDLVHVAIWNREPDRVVYHLIYRDGPDGPAFAKRFTVTGVTRDKPYDLTRGTPGSRVLYLTANPGGGTEVVTISLTPRCKARNKLFEFDFGTLEIRNRAARGTRLTRFPIQRVVRKTTGAATMAGRSLWYDPSVGRLNPDGHGRSLGVLNPDDLLLTVTAAGCLELTGHELTNHYDPTGTVVLEPLRPDTVVSVVHLDGESGRYWAKRFEVPDLAAGRPVRLIGDGPTDRMVLVTTDPDPWLTVQVVRGRSRTPEAFAARLADVVGLKGIKARGNLISPLTVTGVSWRTAPDGGSEGEPASGLAGRLSSPDPTHPPSAADAEREAGTGLDDDTTAPSTRQQPTLFD